MSDGENTETPRVSFGTVRIQESNTECGDSWKQEYALLNGCPPPEHYSIRVPKADMDVRLLFPASATFEEMVRYTERVRHLLTSEARALWNVGQEVGL